MLCGDSRQDGKYMAVCVHFLVRTMAVTEGVDDRDPSAVLLELLAMGAFQRLADSLLRFPRVTAVSQLVLVLLTLAVTSPGKFPRKFHAQIHSTHFTPEGAAVTEHTRYTKIRPAVAIFSSCCMCRPHGCVSPLITLPLSGDGKVLLIVIHAQTAAMCVICMTAAFFTYSLPFHPCYAPPPCTNAERTHVHRR